MQQKTEILQFIKEVESDTNQFYLFRNSEGVKRWIEASHYKTFHFIPGMQVKAITEKKGCAGEAITQIIHPKYIQGKEYQFTIKRTGSLLLNKDMINFLVVIDSLNDEFKITVADTKTYQKGDQILCRLKEQNKGYLKFELA